MSMPPAMQLRMSLARDPSVKNEKLPAGTFKRVLSYARPNSVRIFWLVVFLIVGSAIVVAQPLLSKQLVDRGIVANDARVVVVSAGLIALAAIADAAVGLLTRYLSSRIGEDLILTLRTEVFEHVQHQSMAFFTRTQTGALVSRVNSDVIGAQRAFTSTLSGVLGNIIRVALVIATMVSLSWQLTICVLLLVPVFLLPARFTGRQLQMFSQEQMQLNAEMQASMTEKFNVSGALLVKLFGSVQSETDDFRRKAGRVRDIGVKIALSNSVLFTALMLIAALASAVVYGIGGVMTVEKQVSLGTLLALVGLLSQVYGPLTALSNVRVDVMTALVSFSRVFEVLDLKPMVTDPAQPVSLPTGPLSIEFDCVEFRYPAADEVSLASLEPVMRSDLRTSDQPILSDISFTVPAGSMVALVGPSGAGKTTITSLLPRFYDVTSGSVRIGGVDVRDVSQSALRDAIGVVTQDSHLFHDTIRRNLAYAKPEATEAEMRTSLEAAALGGLLATLPDGLDTVVGERGHRLSGGEKQRMAIARLLLKEPRIVVLDEATSHLDSESEQLIQQAFARALEGRTALVIAHRLSTVRNASAIVVLDGGRVVQTGTHDELLEQGGLYADLYRIQFAD